mmetsp:Transcript_86367/g.220020  ORF Transcript_86367/g.220020 Transcript_86367/m.220020 type:complete len:379 (+) Transcript_86367:374-1510(+)
MRIRGSLRRDSTASAGDDAREAAHEISGDVCPQPELLIVPVSRHKQVQAELLAQRPVPCLVLAVLTAREVGDHDLPGRRRLTEFVLQPDLLLSPQGLEVGGAILDGCRTLRRRAIGTYRVVRLAADVVLRVHPWTLRVVDVRVDHEDVGREQFRRVLHAHHVVRGRHDPAVAGPSVRNLLIPTVVKTTATPIVVAQNAQPRLALEARARVDALKDLVELVMSREGDLIHGGAASLLDAAPVEIVADVQEVLRLIDLGALLHRLRHQLLGLVVHAGHEAAGHRAVRSSSFVALDEILMVAQLDSVVPVPTRPRENAGPRLGAPVVRDEGRPTLDRVQLPIHAAPIADTEDVHLLGTGEGHRGPRHALVVHGLRRRLACD